MNDPEDPAVHGADEEFVGPSSEEGFVGPSSAEKKETAWVGPTVAGEGAEEGEHPDGRPGAGVAAEDDPEDGKSTQDPGTEGPNLSPA